MKSSSNSFREFLAVLSLPLLLSTGCSYFAWTENSQAKMRLDYVQQLDKRVKEGAQPEILAELKALQTLGFYTDEIILNEGDKKKCQCDAEFVGHKDSELFFDSIASVIQQKQTGIKMSVKDGLIIRADFEHRFDTL